METSVASSSSPSSHESLESMKGSGGGAEPLLASSGEAYEAHHLQRSRQGSRGSTGGEQARMLVHDASPANHQDKRMRSDQSVNVGRQRSEPKTVRETERYHILHDDTPIGPSERNERVVAETQRSSREELVSSSAFHRITPSRKTNGGDSSPKRRLNDTDLGSNIMEDRSSTSTPNKEEERFSRRRSMEGSNGNRGNSSSTDYRKGERPCRRRSNEGEVGSKGEGGQRRICSREGIDEFHRTSRRRSIEGSKISQRISSSSGDQDREPPYRIQSNEAGLNSIVVDGISSSFTETKVRERTQRRHSNEVDYSSGSKWNSSSCDKLERERPHWRRSKEPELSGNTVSCLGSLRDCNNGGTFTRRRSNERFPRQNSSGENRLPSDNILMEASNKDHPPRKLEETPSDETKVNRRIRDIEGRSQSASIQEKGTPERRQRGAQAGFASLGSSLRNLARSRSPAPARHDADTVNSQSPESLTRRIDIQSNQATTNIGVSKLMEMRLCQSPLQGNTSNSPQRAERNELKLSRRFSRSRSPSCIGEDGEKRSAIRKVLTRRFARSRSLTPVRDEANNGMVTSTAGLKPTGVFLKRATSGVYKSMAMRLSQSPSREQSSDSIREDKKKDSCRFSRSPSPTYGMEDADKRSAPRKAFIKLGDSLYQLYGKQRATTPKRSHLRENVRDSQTKKTFPRSRRGIPQENHPDMPEDLQPQGCLTSDLASSHSGRSFGRVETSGSGLMSGSDSSRTHRSVRSSGALSETTRSQLRLLVERTPMTVAGDSDKSTKFAVQNKSDHGRSSGGSDVLVQENKPIIQLGTGDAPDHMEGFGLGIVSKDFVPRRRLSFGRIQGSIVEVGEGGASAPNCGRMLRRLSFGASNSNNKVTSELQSAGMPRRISLDGSSIENDSASEVQHGRMPRQMSNGCSIPDNNLAARSDGGRMPRRFSFGSSNPKNNLASEIQSTKMPRQTSFRRSNTDNNYTTQSARMPRRMSLGNSNLQNQVSRQSQSVRMPRRRSVDSSKPDIIAGEGCHSRMPRRFSAGALFKSFSMQDEPIKSHLGDAQEEEVEEEVVYEDIVKEKTEEKHRRAMRRLSNGYASIFEDSAHNADVKVLGKGHDVENEHEDEARDLLAMLMMAEHEDSDSEGDAFDEVE